MNQEPEPRTRNQQLGTAPIEAILTRDLLRSFRQKSRIVGGLARPFMWLLLVGTGYNAIAQVEGASSYQTFVFPGLVAMSAMFGGMLTGVATVYDREFGMLRLMLASPAGVPTLLLGRALAATTIGSIQGVVVLAFAPLLIPVTVGQIAMACGAVVVTAAVSGVIGLLVAAPLRSIENFAGIINVVLFPMLFLSGALYPTTAMPAALRIPARLNPVTYAVDLTRGALGQPMELSAATSLVALALAIVIAFGAAALLFDPERRVARGGRR